MPNNATHNPLFDWFRGVAVLLVLSVHFAQNFHNFELSNRFGAFFDLGKHGVALFFVLSGFLISKSISNIPLTKKNYLKYLAKRLLRIYPAYLASLIVLIFLSENFQPKYSLNFILIQNLFASTFGQLNYPYWSLAIEFQAYLILPVLIHINRRKNAKFLFLSLISISLLWQILGATLRLKYGFDRNYDWSCRFYLLTSISSFIIGIRMSSKLTANELNIAKSISILALVDIFVSLVSGIKGIERKDFLWQGMHGGLGYLSYGTLFGLLILKKIEMQMRIKKSHSNFISKLLESLGRMSYSVYLWHLPLMLFMINTVKAPLASLAFAIVAILIIGSLSYQVIEIPVADLFAKRIRYSGSYD